MRNILKAKDCIVFFDFDNTITKYDILDDIIERFSPGRQWIELERKWLAGKIGSRQCLDGQIRGIRIDKPRLKKYLSKVKIDPSFKKILKLCRRKGIRIYILSDNFGFILKGILKYNGVKNIKVYCNSLVFSRGHLLPKFPYLNKKCHKCAHCKKGNLVARAGKDAVTIYVGDGLSDICPAERADIVFAKGHLKRYFRKQGIRHVPIDRLNEVYKFLKTLR